MKVLCFTPSLNRYKMLRGCVQDINCQTYQDIFHSVNITMERSTHQKNYVEKIFDDLKTDKNKFSYTLNQKGHLKNGVVFRILRFQMITYHLRNLLYHLLFLFYH